MYWLMHYKFTHSIDKVCDRSSRQRMTDLSETIVKAFICDNLDMIVF